MPDRESAGSDFFRLWLEGNRALFESGGGPLWAQAERVFRDWSRFAEAFAAADAGRRTAEGASPFDPAGWLRPAGGGGMADLLRWLEGPTFAGPAGEGAEWVRGTREWLAYLAAVEQMKAGLAEGWRAAFRAFVERFAAEDRAAREAGRPAPGWDRMRAVWSEVASAEMAATYRKPACLAAQRDLIRAETELRASLRGRVERVATELGLPTRAELDDLSETVHAMGRELRRMRAGARAARPGPGGGAGGR